jgi:hypothetical protein
MMDAWIRYMTTVIKNTFVLQAKVSQHLLAQAHASAKIQQPSGFKKKKKKKKKKG